MAQNKYAMFKHMVLTDSKLSQLVRCTHIDENILGTYVCVRKPPMI